MLPQSRTGAARRSGGHVRLVPAQCGFGLLEVLVAVAVLSIGLLGMAALQVNSLKNNQASFQRTQAVMLSYLAMDVLRTNRTAAIAGDYNLDKTCGAPPLGSSLVASDKMFWLSVIQESLGGESSCGEISCQSRVCTVRVYWGEERATGGASEHMFETTTQL